MSTLSSDTFGQRVKQLRLKKGIRQTDLAVQARISWRHLIRIEQDRGGVTKPSTVAQIAEALGVDPSDLTGAADDEEESESVLSLDDLLRLRVRQILRDERAAVAG
jgi:transcriptional regulator with XRE-family HTH domain